MEGEMSFEEWVATVPERVKAEACWRFAAYPKALYVYELAWDDCDALMRDERGEFLLEVKSCNLIEQGLCLFPDAPTIRGRNAPSAARQ